MTHLSDLARIRKTLPRVWTQHYRCDLGAGKQVDILMNGFNGVSFQKRPPGIIVVEKTRRTTAGFPGRQRRLLLPFYTTSTQDACDIRLHPPSTCPLISH